MLSRHVTHGKENRLRNSPRCGAGVYTVDRVTRSSWRTTMAKRGRKGITLEDVRAACERLALQRRIVGPINVRLELGGRGSYGTIMKHLKTLGITTKGTGADLRKHRN